MRDLSAAAAVALLLVSACSDGPTRPSMVPTASLASSSADASSVLQIVSGETGAPVASANVTVGTSPLTTDVSGQVTVPYVARFGTFVDVEQPGYLLRQTRLLASSGTVFSLIPKTSPTGLNEDFVRDVLYHETSSNEHRYMMRIRPGTEAAFVVPSEQIRNDLRAMRAVHDAAAQIEGVLGDAIRFVVTADPPAGAVSFALVVDPNDPRIHDGDAIAVAYRDFSGWNIIGGRVVYDSIETARSSATHHELGHMVGLGHSNAASDVMYPYQRNRVETFSPRERLGMRLLLQRPALNRFPDNDRDVRDPKTQRATATRFVVCYR